MSEQPRIFELPQHIDRYLAALSKLYAQEGKRQLQEIIVNAQTRVREEWTYDNWRGGTSGHALYLVIPESLFLSTVKMKSEFQDQIKDDLNNLHNVQDEFIAVVFLEIGSEEGLDWRQESGLMVTGTRVVPPDATKRIWGEEGFRVFLSHKSEVKRETAELQEQLQLFGISSFVAHRDIHPTKPWQDEIENALASMDGFVALLTDNFHDSDWTDQEVGYAFARGVPIIAVRLGKDPYGFIGKFQGLSSAWQTAAEDIVKILIKNDRMFTAYIRALRQCSSWDNGNTLAKALQGLDTASEQQIDALIAAYNATSELRGSFGFNGSKPQYYGLGLLSHLHRLGTRRFRVSSARLIEGIS